MEATDTRNGNGVTTAIQGGKAKAKNPPSRRNLPSLPTASSVSDMAQVTYRGLVDNTPTEWNQLKNYELFSLSSDGSFPMVKCSRSKAVQLHDRQVMMVGSGRCYRINNLSSQ